MQIARQRTVSVCPKTTVDGDSVRMVLGVTLGENPLTNIKLDYRKLLGGNLHLAIHLRTWTIHGPHWLTKHGLATAVA